MNPAICRTIPSMILLYSLGLSSAPAGSAVVGQPEAATIRASVVDPDGIDITIHNPRPQPIEAWVFQIVFDTATTAGVQQQVTTDVYPSLALPQHVPDGPIAAGETRVIRMGAQEARSVRSVTLLLALYNDLSYEGQRDKLQEVLKKRDNDAAELSEWISVLAKVRASSTAEVRSRLEQALAADKGRQLSKGGVSSTVAGTVRSALLVTERAPDRLPDTIDALMDLFTRQLELARRHRTR